MELKLYWAAMVAQITAGTIWDFLPLLVVTLALLVWARKGQRVSEGRWRATAGLLLLLAATFLDWSDEWYFLNRVVILGRASVWHEPLEDFFYLVGITAFLSHWKSLIHYR